VDEGARFIFGQRAIRLHHPIGEAITTKTRKAHQVDILRIVPVLQMDHEAAKCGCGRRV
jgi:hypothetical protein